MKVFQFCFISMNHCVFLLYYSTVLFRYMVTLKSIQTTSLFYTFYFVVHLFHNWKITDNDKAFFFFNFLKKFWIKILKLVLKPSLWLSLTVCFGSLQYWKFNCWPSLRSHALWRRISSRTSRIWLHSSFFLRRTNIELDIGESRYVIYNILTKLRH